MPAIMFAAFEAQALQAGYDQAVERRWEPLTVLGTHTHPFAAKATVVEGEMWLTVQGKTRHLLPGDGFELAAGEPHAERYGPQGATYWVARRGGDDAPAPGY